MILEIENSEYIINAIEYDADINQLELLEGNLPQKENECVVEERFITELNVKIGDSIEISEDEEETSFKSTNLVIVGIVKSPLYISIDRGSSKLGSGKVDYYIYISKDNIDAEIYTSIYITVASAKEAEIYTQKYDNLIGNVKNELKNISSEREQHRYDGLINEATTKLNEAEAELNDEKEKANKEITKAENEIQNAENQIAKGEKELNSNIAKADKEFADAEAELDTQLAIIEQGIQSIMDIYNFSDDMTKLVLDVELEQLETGKNQIENGKLELAETKLSTYGKLEQAKKNIVSAKQKLADGRKELEENKIEFENKVKEAEEKLADAKEKIKDIEYPKWYVLNRKEANSGYNALIQDSESINDISKVFPFIFFAVATLMSLTSMTRMIDEQRTQIGTLKALGYHKFQIASKYIIYSILATVLGGMIGILLGYSMIPSIIINAYSTALYSFPVSPIVYDPYLAMGGLLAISICIVGGAVYASYRKLRHVPATLMRPKAPKPGKRVFLERITFIWKRLSFTKKVTVRNIFRYKKRFLMTIVGIFGATALIIVGFGIKNSISEIAPTQYNEIYKYQMLLGLNKSITDEERDNIIKDIKNNEQIKNLLSVDMQGFKIVKNDETKDAQLMVINNKEEMNDFINLRNSKSKEQHKLEDDKVIITERVSRILNIKQGDTITIKNEDDKEKNVVVGAITEQYIFHYIYMTEDLYRQLYEEEPKANTLLIKTKIQDVEKELELGKELLRDDRISSVNVLSDSVPQINKTMKTLNYVVVVLIVSAGLLAFIVLYNLSNVNISERIRELATLKVLGFYDKEVNQYVSRETIILTIIGILSGLGGGYFLTYFILQTVEQEFIMYPKVIEPISYLYAIIMVLAFTTIVNIASHFVLKKISMVDSLKSIE